MPRTTWANSWPFGERSTSGRSAGPALVKPTARDDAHSTARHRRRQVGAVDQIREVLPETPAAFLADRTAREVVTFNLFLSLQDTIALATHWLADEGVAVATPRSCKT